MSIGLAWRVYEPDYGAAPGCRARQRRRPTAIRWFRCGRRARDWVPATSCSSTTSTTPRPRSGSCSGRELETFTAGFDSPGAGLRQFSFTGQHWLTPSWALSYDVLSNDPSSFRLQGLRLGVRYRF